jgi:hypothetical protein
VHLADGVDPVLRLADDVELSARRKEIDQDAPDEPAVVDDQD